MKKILFISFSVLLFSCGGGTKKDSKQNESNNTVQNESKSENTPSKVETPMSGIIKEVKKTQNGIDVLVTIENLVDEKLTPNLFFTKLEDEEGLECKVEIISSREPSFNYKDMYKNDKSSGWLSFKFPTSNYVPKKIVFNKIMGGKLCELMIP
jgi:hypothetical protein